MRVQKKSHPPDHRGLAPKHEANGADRSPAVEATLTAVATKVKSLADRHPTGGTEREVLIIIRVHRHLRPLEVYNVGLLLFSGKVTPPPHWHRKLALS
jgi:hypothetical protein